MPLLDIGGQKTGLLGFGGASGTGSFSALGSGVVGTGQQRTSSGVGLADLFFELALLPDAPICGCRKAT